MRAEKWGSIRNLPSVLAGVFGLFLAASVDGHPLAPALLELRPLGSGQVEVMWKVPAQQPAGLDLRPALPASCERLGPEVGRLEGTGWVRRFRLNCVSPLAGSQVGVAGLGTTSALLRIPWPDGKTFQRVLTAEEDLVAIPEAPSRWTTAIDYGRLGFDHLLEGLDHILFVLGLLLLVSGAKDLFFTVTSFTLGHSVTLSLATLGWVAVPSTPVEILIAASLLVLAYELCSDTESKDAASLLRRRPWLMSGLFGLLHGLGFAGALSEIGLPAAEIPLALLAFNVGIEFGQLAVIALALAGTPLVRRLERPQRMLLARAAVYALGCQATFWIFERGSELF